MYKYEDIKTIHLENTQNCQASCPMCNRNINGGLDNPLIKINNWTLQEFQQIMSIEVLEQIYGLYFCGNFGDPCACKEFVNIYEYCREINPGMGLACNTNGSLRNPAWWGRLGAVMREEQNLGNYCTFSLDGLEDTNHLYRRNTNWKKIMENAQAFIEAVKSYPDRNL